MAIKILPPNAGLPAPLDLGKGVPPVALSKGDAPNVGVWNNDLLNAVTNGGATSHVDVDTSRPADPGLMSPNSIPGQTLGPGIQSPLDSMPITTVAPERIALGPLPIIGVMPSQVPNQDDKY